MPLVILVTMRGEFADSMHLSVEESRPFDGGNAVYTSVL
jgi:hypothetical protein